MTNLPAVFSLENHREPKGIEAQGVADLDNDFERETFGFTFKIIALLSNAKHRKYRKGRRDLSNFPVTLQ
jgi:hypothetical protein